jgi:hypothetical protein
MSFATELDRIPELPGDHLLSKKVNSVQQFPPESQAKQRGQGATRQGNAAGAPYGDYLR